MAIDSSSPRTRRAILFGALGGAFASVAAAVGRASPVTATNGDIVKVGHTYTATRATVINANGSGAAFMATSQSSWALSGTSTSGGGVYAATTGTSAGVYGYSASGHGVSGDSKSSSGVYGIAGAAGKVAIQGWSTHGNGTGVLGYSGAITTSSSPAKTGVFGSADVDARAVGVRGQSSPGTGVFDSSTSGTGITGVSASGVGVRGVSSSHRGGVFTSPVANFGCTRRRGRILLRARSVTCSWMPRGTCGTARPPPRG